MSADQETSKNFDAALKAALEKANQGKPLSERLNEEAAFTTKLLNKKKSESTPTSLENDA